MEKNKVFALIALSATALTTCVFASCNLGGGGNSGSSEEAIREKVVSIADFETWESGFQLIRTDSMFGQIRVNKNADYVKTGERSAQIHAMGGYRTGSAPAFFFPTKSDLFNFDHSDFIDAEKITFEFYYNKRETDPETAKVAVGLVTSITQVGTYNKTPIIYQELQPGWNTITYTVNVSALDITADVNDIQGIYVGFENAKTREESGALDIYLDDVTLYRYDEPQEIQNLVDLEENEFADFEKDWQQYVVSARSTACSPDVNIVTASDYKIGPAPAEGEDDTRETLQAKSGEKVLRLLATGSTNTNSFYPGVNFAKALFDKSVFSTLGETDYGAVTFSMDIFNNSAVKTRFGISFYNATAKKRKEYGREVDPYSWHTFEINLKTLYEDFAAANEGKASFFNDPGPGNLSIYWPEYIGENREFFIDNMHFIVEEKDPNAMPEIEMTAFSRRVKVGTTLELPVIGVTDKYNLSLQATTEVFYNDTTTDVDNWVTVQLKKGKVPIDKLGEYKLVVTTDPNCVGNCAVLEYPFLGVEKVDSNVWTDYTFADEAGSIYVGKKSDTNYTQWLETTDIGGETHEGVIKAVADNADQYAAGWFGFNFAKDLVKAAGSWDYFVVRMYIDTGTHNKSTVNIYSWNKKLYDAVETGKWIDLKITKEMLGGGGSKTYINNGTAPMTDEAFYSAFISHCTGEEMGWLLRTTTIKGVGTAPITYYIDQVTWVKLEHGYYEEGDDGAADIYGDEYVDPWMKKENE